MGRDRSVPRVGARFGYTYANAAPINNLEKTILVMLESFMERQTIISDFTGLVNQVAEKISKYKIYTCIGRDKNTVDRWLDGTQPNDLIDVGRLVDLALHNGVSVDPFQSYTPIYDFSAETSYEEKLAAGPPDLGWIRKLYQTIPSSTVDVCGLKVDCPVGIGASPLTGDEHWSIAMLELGFGLSTFKTRRTASKEALLKPQVAYVLETPSLLDLSALPKAIVTMKKSDVHEKIPNLVNSMGVPSESVGAWQACFHKIQNHPRGHFMGISVIGDADAENGLLADFLDAVSHAGRSEPPFVELNLSCPNLKGKDFHADLNLLSELCKGARSRLKSRTLLFAKLAFVCPDQLAAIVKTIGPLVDAIVFQNTIRVRVAQRDGNGDHHSPFPGRDTGGLSGPSTFPLTLKGVQFLDQERRKLGLRFAIIAVGGVTDANGVQKLLESGASAVQAVTAPMFDPLLAWKVRHNKRDVSYRAGLLQPSLNSEYISLKNAIEAFSDVRRRKPDLPDSAFAEKWNLFMDKSPQQLPGQAQRVNRLKSVSDWVKDFRS